MEGVSLVSNSKFQGRSDDFELEWEVLDWRAKGGDSCSCLNPKEDLRTGVMIPVPNSELVLRINLMEEGLRDLETFKEEEEEKVW